MGQDAGISAGSDEIGQMRNFTETGAKLTLARTSDTMTWSSDPGTRFWALFCGLAERLRFPPTEDAVLAWPNFFAPGRTLGLHTAP